MQTCPLCPARRATLGGGWLCALLRTGGRARQSMRVCPPFAAAWSSLLSIDGRVLCARLPLPSKLQAPRACTLAASGIEPAGLELPIRQARRLAVSSLEPAGGWQLQAAGGWQLQALNLQVWRLGN